MFLFKNFITRPFLSTVVIFAVLHIFVFLLEYDAYVALGLLTAGVFSLLKKILEDLGG